MNDNISKPNVSIVLDCIPKNINELKNNIQYFYDVCNEVIDDPTCFYSDEEIENLKNDKKMQKKLNIKFI